MKVHLALYSVILAGLMGLVPMELLTCYLTIKFEKRRSFISLGISTYLAIYIVLFSTSLHHFTTGNEVVPTYISDVIKKIGEEDLTEKWHLPRALYYPILFGIGFPPGVLKFGIAYCTLYPSWHALLILVTGTTTRTYLIVRYGPKLFRRIARALVEKANGFRNEKIEREPLE